RVYAASNNGPVYRLASTGACIPPAGAAPPPAPASPAPAPAVVPAASDTRAPGLRVRAARRQHVLRKGYAAIRIRCDEPCAVRVRGTALLQRRRPTASSPAAATPA